MPELITPTQKLVAQMYKDDRGNPIELTEGQDEIFSGIAQKKHNRMHIMCHTRYGKSMSVGLAVLTRAASFPEKWAIIAGKKNKAQIIMDYIIGHIFDNDFTRNRFVPDKGENIEEIRRRRNKNRLTFAVGKDAQGLTLLSEVFVGSAADALGFGAPNVVEDESALIDDDEHALVMRMLGDNPRENFMCKIGNPFRRNHFLDSYHDPAYKKVTIDCYRSLEEGRITQATIDEMKNMAFFSILYEDKFPSQTEVDESGWMYLVTDADVTTAQNRKSEEFGDRRIGLDVARGGRNYNAWVLRGANYAKVIAKTKQSDPVEIVEDTIRYMREYGVKDTNLFIDDTGVGWGVTGIFKNRNMKVNAVTLGGSASDPNYANVRAEIYAGQNGLQPWLRQTGRIDPHKDWIELTRIRYKKNNGSKTIIESKEDMLKRGVESPDIADALALTFAKSTISEYYGVDPAVIAAGGVKPLYPGMPG